MARYGQDNKVVVGALVLVTAVIVVAILLSVVQFSENNSGKTNVDSDRQNLLSTNEDNAVIMSVRGDIVAQEDFTAYDVVVTPSQRKVIVYKGYDKKIVQQNKFPNTPSAYEQFVYALNNVGLVSKQRSDDSDMRGICPTGDLYEFKLMSGDNILRTLWTNSCNYRQGTFGAKLSTVKQLFVDQIPDYEKIMKGF